MNVLNAACHTIKLLFLTDYNRDMNKSQSQGLEGPNMSGRHYFDVHPKLLLVMCICVK